ncbi:MAG: helix-turn-helix domain-containing protein [Hyphomonadaceae bacterium]|nr:helix-turn-helix domain-containing protein [Hyphomonadaceae bacterium]
MRWSQIDAIPCPLAQAMSVIGDSWTLLILRDAMRGARKFDEFQQSTRASRAVISARLAHLVERGVMERVQYEAHPPRYEYRLTNRGLALQPVMMTMAHWAETHLPKPVRSAGRRHTTCGHKFRPVVTCSECGETVTPETVTFDRPPALAGSK